MINRRLFVDKDSDKDIQKKFKNVHIVHVSDFVFPSCVIKHEVN